MRRRLLTSYLALTFVVLVVLEVPLAVTYGDRARDQLTSGLERDAFVLAAFAEDSIQGQGGPDLQQLADGYEARTGGRVVIVDQQGDVIADSDPVGSGSRSFAGRPEIDAALADQVTTGTRRSDTLGTELLYAAVPIGSGGEVYGALRVSYSTAQVERRVHRYWAVLAGIGAVSLLAAALLAVVLSRWVARPLVDLRDAAGDLGAGDLATRAPTDSGPPEVRDLARTFNDMAGRLEDLVRAQESFVADASHQLRTPLTALRLRLENLEEEIADDEAADDVAAARAETQRLSRLVDGLLALARADRRAGDVDRVDVAVDEIIAERLDAWRPIAEEYGLSLLGEPSGLHARVTPDRLAQVLDNLLANATEASPAGSDLWVRTGRSPDRRWIEVHVVDRGAGLTEEQRRHAFDRFWRADGAAVPSTPDRLGGTGLGLAIVRQLVRADGGEVELAEAPGGGVDAVVRLVPTST